MKPFTPAYPADPDGTPLATIDLVYALQAMRGFGDILLCQQENLWDTPARPRPRDLAQLQCTLFQAITEACWENVDLGFDFDTPKT